MKLAGKIVFQLKKPTLCLLNRYVKDIKYRFSEKCKNYFWEWRFGKGDADALERERNIPLREILFSSVCLYVFCCLSFSFFLCLFVCSISRHSVCSAFNGQDKNTQSWGLWLSHSITGTKCLFSVCLYVCFLFVYVFFLAFFTFVSYLFVLVSCLSVRLFLIWLCESVSFLCLFICPFLVFL